MQQPRLSQRARRSLEERLAQLEKDRIPRLERELDESRDPSIEAALAATREMASRFREALAKAKPLEDEPHDPTVVELGDTVTVRREGSRERERFTLVGEVEARLDDSWVSVRSPIGSVLLGAHAGETVVAATPEGPARYEVLGIERA